MGKEVGNEEVEEGGGRVGGRGKEGGQEIVNVEGGEEGRKRGGGEGRGEEGGRKGRGGVSVKEKVGRHGEEQGRRKGTSKTRYY